MTKSRSEELTNYSVICLDQPFLDKKVMKRGSAFFPQDGFLFLNTTMMNGRRVMSLAMGTLSSGNADGDGNAKTCVKAGERTPLWREFTNIKQHRQKPRFPH